MTSTDWLLLGLVAEFILFGIVWVLSFRAGVTRLLGAIKAEVIETKWDALPFPVEGRPDCGHAGPITHRHSTGASACRACGAGQGPTP